MIAGLRRTLSATGDPLNIVATRSGAESEYMSMISRDALGATRGLAGVAKDSSGQPLISAEAVGIILLGRRNGTGDVNLTVRGMKSIGIALRPKIRLVSGRWFNPGVRELVVSKSVQQRFVDTDLGSSVHFGKGDWTVVGVFDGGGNAQESELWGDLDMVSADMNRPRFSSLLIRAAGIEDRSSILATLEQDKRLRLHAVTETEYYGRQVRTGQTIRFVSEIVIVILGIGSCFALANTMFAATSSRIREIAALRVMGFSRAQILASFLTESLMVSVLGGGVGILAALPFSNLTTGTLNGFTFSELVFRISITPTTVAGCLALAGLLGVVGGILPAAIAAYQNISTIIRD
jgi:ABC-type antimicrobial peptide transport system permease subunit